MLRDEENFVGLFIDWDNLAISTAVDFGGALPDVRAIVKAAQRSGTVLIARAYAEWNATSDRLAVYRAGVEPVYAPTFRFEPEPGSQTRGKSLADPCLVTDCIDLLHTMPEINTFVLVSGDKDLIPIVRLVQLRGKRVVVIGPDFVAAILREMADEYVPYRILAETSDSPPSTEVSTYGPRGQRRHQNGSSNVARGAQSQSSQRSALSQSRVASRVAPVEASVNGSAGLDTMPTAKVEVARVEVPKVEPTRPEPTRVEPPPPEPSVPEALTAAPLPTEELRDTAPLFDLISSILRDREQAGKPRLRATNLKDQLLARVSGFNERKYGFARFKDLLAAAEKAGVLTVSRTGPVQWVTAVPSTPPTLAPAPTVSEAPPVVAGPATEAPTVDVDVDVVRYLLDLRERSRWLTYTYLMTNMVNHLGMGTVDADAAVRATLNRLVQSGVLIVDKEPREIDVNGVKHRVKMCHIVDEHPLVAALQAEKAAATPLVVEAETPAEAPEAVYAVETVAAPESAPATAEASVEAAVAPTEPVTESAVEEPNAEPSPAPASGWWNAPLEVEAEAEAREPETSPVAVPEADVREATNGDTGGEETSVAEEKAGNGNGHTAAPLSLEESYAILREVVRDATGPSRPSTGPAAVKNRLVRRLGSFDERAFGFSKFKDYLLAAERAGAIHVEVVGTSARVSLREDEKPSPEEPAEAAPSENEPAQPEAAQVE